MEDLEGGMSTHTDVPTADGTRAVAPNRSSRRRPDGDRHPGDPTTSGTPTANRHAVATGGLRARLTAAGFLTPAVMLVAVLLILPFAFTVYRSFFDDNGFRRRWVGLANYGALLTDPVFGQSLLNTLMWVVGTLVLPVGIGLLIAAATWRLRLGGLARLAIVLPYAISGAATAVVWTFMLSSDGALTSMLQSVGLGQFAQQWLLQWPLNTVMMIIATTWQATGANVILFLVGLQGIPQNTLEAGELDGASGWRLFRFVTFPQLRAITVVVIGISIVNSLKVFDQVLLLTNGGPGTSSETLALTMYRETFTLQRYGAGAAVAVFLTIVVVVASVFYLRRQLAPDSK
jgi:ABC-type sugar transport system permease subunit